MRPASTGEMTTREKSRSLTSAPPDHKHSIEEMAMVGRSSSAGPQQQQADVFVIFGITGDLAKVMTFRSLYRLEKRGLLQCPIVGVAVDDWNVEQVVERDRESINATGEQHDNDVIEPFGAHLYYVHGDVADA